MTHILRVIWILEYNGDTHFHIWPKIRPNSGQNGQCLKLKVSFKTCLSCPVLSESYKNVIYWCKTIINPESRVSKIWSHCLYLFSFFVIAQQKMKSAWNCMHLFLLCIIMVHELFYIYSEFRFYRKKFLKKSKFEFWCRYLKIWRIRCIPLVERLFLYTFSFFVWVCSKTLHFTSTWKFDSTQSRVTWSH